MAIRCADSRFRRWSFFLTVVFFVPQAALGQGSYTAQLRGTVTDPAHAVVNNAKVTVTNESWHSLRTRTQATTTAIASGFLVTRCRAMLRGSPPMPEGKGSRILTWGFSRTSLCERE